MRLTPQEHATLTSLREAHSQAHRAYNQAIRARDAIDGRKKQERQAATNIVSRLGKEWGDTHAKANTYEAELLAERLGFDTDGIQVTEDGFVEVTIGLDLLRRLVKSGYPGCVSEDVEFRRLLREARRA
jgi:hypothetical protein